MVNFQPQGRREVLSPAIFPASRWCPGFFAFEGRNHHVRERPSIGVVGNEYPSKLRQTDSAGATGREWAI